MSPERFHPAVEAWFARTFEAPTPAQVDAWPAIQAARDVLIAAPTGSGKTLAAFMAGELLMVYRRLEARGEIRGGRFVAGFSGEQYATPAAIGALREHRRRNDGGGWVSISAADPLNVLGLLTPRSRVPALTGNRILHRDGVPIAAYSGGEVNFYETLEGPAQWEAHNLLLRRPTPRVLADLT